MRFSKFLPGHLCVWLFIIVATSFTAEARDKMIDGKTADTAAKLANDREAAFSGDEAMPLEAFKSQWTALQPDPAHCFVLLDPNFLGTGPWTLCVLQK